MNRSGEARTFHCPVFYLTIRKMFSGAPITGTNKQKLDNALLYLHTNAPAQLQVYVGFTDQTIYRLVPYNGAFDAQTVPPKLFPMTVQLTPSCFAINKHFLAATLLHEAVHARVEAFFTGDGSPALGFLYDPKPYQVESDFLKSIGVNDTAANLKTQYTETYDRVFIDTAAANFKDAGIQSPAIR